MTVRRLANVIVLLFIGTLTVSAKEPASKPGYSEDDNLRPGLIAQYRSRVDANATLTRLDAKPCFSWGLSSPHPRLPPGPFEVVWTGLLVVRDEEPITLDAHVCGSLTVELDGVTILQGEGKRATDRLVSQHPLKREPGPFRITIRYQSLPGRPARLQIGWQSASFPAQPIPAWQFKHTPADEPAALARDDAKARGGRAVSRFGCARCHASAFPGVKDGLPGPSLADIRTRIQGPWLLKWLADPAKVRPGAHMPAVFPPDRQGAIERHVVVDHLLHGSPTNQRAAKGPRGDHRVGRTAFIHLGCAACHFLPELPPSRQADLGRQPFIGLADRLPSANLGAFLLNPQCRYVDGRMPRFAMSLQTAQDIAAYLLLWSKATTPVADEPPPSPAEVWALLHRLKASTRQAAASILIQTRGCVQCHPGLESPRPMDVRISTTAKAHGCLSATGLPHFTMDAQTRSDVGAYLSGAARDKYASPVAQRQRLLERAGCVHCHQRDTDLPPAIEQAGSALGGSLLETVPYQRAPRLSQAHQKYHASYLLDVVRNGARGLKGPRYSYQMPAFGADAPALVQAVAEADGNIPMRPEPKDAQAADPTLGPLMGSALTGFQGYACVACHVWAGRYLADPDPGAVGPDLTRTSGRIRRDWFDRFLEDPSGFHPGTPMPAIFPRGGPTAIASVLNGDPVRQKEALWRYFALGQAAPSPQPPPPLPIAAPVVGEPALVAQIPIRLPDRTLVESITVLDTTHDLLVYDLARHGLRAIFTGAEILRHAQGRQRWFAIEGKSFADNLNAEPVLCLTNAGKSVALSASILHGYDRLADGVGIRWQAQFGSDRMEVAEVLRFISSKPGRRLMHTLQFTGVPAGHVVQWRGRRPTALAMRLHATHGTAKSIRSGDMLTVMMTPASDHDIAVTTTYELPPSQIPPLRKWTVRVEPERLQGSLERPGYRAIAYPQPKTIAGDDRIMPAALAIHPRTGQVFMASWKTGELFVLDDATDDGKAAHFRNYAHGLFQDCLAMHAEDDGLYVLHRRNLTRLSDTTGAGVADRFERVLALPHGVADTYDYAYGLVRDRTGAFVLSYAPYANTGMPGSGAALRWKPGHTPTEIAFGFRNPLGWCTGPDGEIFFTDNQGEWVATNKLCHLEQGRFYGFPNPAQKQHASRPRGGTAIWVPYGWAHSINGVAYDNTDGKFGPFHGQFFLAELMFGGAIIRAQVEKVNGQYQGACFPFWGRGLMGPLTLAFDPRGRLFVGSLTEPGWMAQPDRGGLFRIDFTGQIPFEMQAIHVRPHGFRIDFTARLAVETAQRLRSYHLEHYRYEYTGAYGSPELDRTPVAVERAIVSADRRSVELTTSPLVKNRVYRLRLLGVRSAKGDPLVHDQAAYTLNEIPNH